MTSLAAAREAIHQEKNNNKPQTDPKPRTNLAELAAECKQNGQALFTEPREGVPVGGQGLLYYNAASSQLPPARPPKPWTRRLHAGIPYLWRPSVIVLREAELPPTQS